MLRSLTCCVSELHRGPAIAKQWSFAAHEGVKAVGKRVKSIRLCPKERGRWRASVRPSVCPSVVDPLEQDWVIAGHLQELLIIEVVLGFPQREVVLIIGWGTGARRPLGR